MSDSHKIRRVKFNDVVQIMNENETNDISWNEINEYDTNHYELESTANSLNTPVVVAVIVCFLFLLVRNKT